MEPDSGRQVDDTRLIGLMLQRLDVAATYLLVPLLACFALTFLSEMLIAGPSGYYLPMRVIAWAILSATTLAGIIVVARWVPDRLCLLIGGIALTPLAGSLYELLRLSWLNGVRGLFIALAYSAPLTLVALIVLAVISFRAARR